MTAVSAIKHIPPTKMTKKEFEEHNVSWALLGQPDVLDAIKNTPGAELTPKGLKLDVVRYQPPDQAGGRAIRTGIFYLPTKKSPDQHYYSKGKAGYGGTDRFEGETIYRCPLVVKGATGGRCPEMAYDFILGKKAYEKMRSQVLKDAPMPSRMVYWRSEKVDPKKQVEDLLKRFGGQPNFAYDIESNSTKGNTMMYAIQEHIVACEVRRGGYDSVIGYTKHKGGFRLSEVFDLREEGYPWQPHWKKDYEDFYEEQWDNVRKK